jgi:hypothetical protein
MTKQVWLTVFIAAFASIASIGTLSAQARQCSAARPASAHGYWSYRLIDGRKCWYEGKKMLSKSLLAWPSHTPAKAGLEAEPAHELRDKLGEPLDANAWAPDDFDTFETRWRAIGPAH